MVIALAVVALVAVAVAGAWSVRATAQAGATAQRATDRLLEASLKLHEMMPTVPEPVIIPAPDLTPYLRELAAGISLVVSGPPQQAQEQGANEEQGEGERVEPDEGVVYPAWEVDESWGLTDSSEQDGEWSAHTMPLRVEDTSFGGNGFGAGGIHLPEPGL